MIYRVAFVVLLLACMTSCIRANNLLEDAKPVMDDDIVNYVNSVQTMWVAHKNPKFEKMTKGQFKTMLGSRKDSLAAVMTDKVTREMDNLPDSFDWRQQPLGKCIGAVLDQGHCGSCWAVSAVSTLSDRFCIASQGKVQVLLSAQDLTSCTSAGSCDGGWPSSAWDVFVHSGVPTEGCMPYQMGTCQHPGCSDWPTPKCPGQTCKNSETWSSSLHYAKKSYGVASTDNAIKTEIVTNGPVQAAFDVYSDFAHYKSGIYSHTTGSFLGGHAIEIVGYGSQNNVNYWIVRNSWNTDWGMDGYFWIKTGDSGINNEVIAGVPKL